MIDTARLALPDPGSLPSDPFPEPSYPPTPSEDSPDGPLGVPQPGPDTIDPGIGEPIGIPPGAPPEIPGGSPGPMVFC